MLRHHVNLKSYHSFKFDVTAQNFYDIKNYQTRKELCLQDILRNKTYILWAGSNTIFHSSHTQTTIIHPSIYGIQIIQSWDTGDLIQVWASEDWTNFVIWTLDHGYHGLENLIDIPSSVGATPIQNIWAYGAEVKNYIHSVIFWDRHGVQQILSAEDCHFSYRDSIFKHDLYQQGMIASVIFDLPYYQAHSYHPQIWYQDITTYLQKHDIDSTALTPSHVANIVSKIRSSKLPDRHHIGTAWSFFKNPIIDQDQYKSLCQLHPDLDIKAYNIDDQYTKLSAGQLIELCGYKGYHTGHVWVYQKHALVLIHDGKGHCEELINLVTHIQHNVYTKFHINLEPEVCIVP